MCHTRSLVKHGLLGWAWDSVAQREGERKGGKEGVGGKTTETYDIMTQQPVVPGVDIIRVRECRHYNSAILHCCRKNNSSSR